MAGQSAASSPAVSATPFTTTTTALGVGPVSAVYSPTSVTTFSVTVTTANDTALASGQSASVMAGMLSCSAILTPTGTGASGSCTITGLPGGTYSPSATYAGNAADHASSSPTQAYTVAPFAITATVTGTESYGSAPVFTYTSNAPAGALSGTPSCSSAGGKALSTLAPGTYTLDGSNCTGLVLSSTTDYTLKFTGGALVVSKGATTLVAAAPVSTPGSFTKTWSATLTVSATNAPIQGQRVVFSIGGETVCTAITNTKGVATCTPSALSIGNYLASYAGNTDYDASSGTS